MYILGTVEELLALGFALLKERLWSLENDVNRCLSDVIAALPEHLKPAPFPAMLYCFSTAEWLGSLLGGDASDHAPSTQQTKDYMKRFMSYTDEQAELLVRLYRHKLTHLAQPAPILELDGKRISWHMYHSNPEKHLLLKKLRKPKKIALTSTVSIHFDYVFHIGIMEFMYDIRDSVYRKNGYRDSLGNSPALQEKLDSALADIYSLRSK